MDRRVAVRAVGWFALLFLLAPSAGRAKLSGDTEAALREATYVYVSSTRKDGNLGTPAEIWFMYHEGAVYVGTRPTSWRVRRIRWGRPQAKIWVGRRDGPSFAARGELVNDGKIQELMMAAYAKKYPDGWPRYAEEFRKGFADGSRVVVRYVPE